MKTRLVISCLFVFAFHYCSYSQYYLRGEIRDEKNTPISNARIILHSNGLLYSSGGSGSFGIVSAKAIDSITITQDGYQTTCVQLEASKYQQIVVKMLHAAAVSRNRLVSVTKDLRLEDRENWTVGGETYSSLLENEFIVSQKFPETGFAIHTDKASYSNIRRFINMNTMVPPMRFVPKKF